MKIGVKAAELPVPVQRVIAWLRLHCTKDKFVIVVAVVGALAAFSFSFLDIDSTGSRWRIAAAAVCSLCLLSALFFPANGAAITFVVTISFDVLGYSSASAWLIIVICSTFVIGLTSNRLLLTLLPFDAMGLYCFTALIEGDFEVSEVSLFFIMFLCPWLAGVLIRRQRELQGEIESAHRFELENIQLQRQQRDTRLARDIHDSVTNELSYIILLSSDDGEAITANQQKIISQKAKDALNEVHLIISLLDGKVTEQQKKSAAPPESFADGLREYCHRQDVGLQAAGYHGGSRVNGTAANAPEASASAVGHVLTEIYANIMRHCGPRTDRYSVIITCSDTAVTIFQTNTCRGNEHQLAGVKHGNGILLQRRTVEKLGGTLNAACEDNTWLLNCTIPLLEPEAVQ